MIRIANWLLTRRCNLQCGYCGISKHDNCIPPEYKNLKYYNDNEMNIEFVIESLKRLNKHNKDMFHIFYGGEPLLRDDLIDIIEFCNKEDINYTIISNCSNGIKNRLNEFFDKISYVKGFTISVDPILMSDFPNIEDDEYIKSFQSLYNIEPWMRIKISDMVAETTVSENNIQYLEKLLRMLYLFRISVDITFVDKKKSFYYDFSNIYDNLEMVEKNKKLEEFLGRMCNIYNDNIHMADILPNKIYNILPSNFDCELEKGIHTLTIDSDGSVRLCLRIRGVETPNNNLLNYIDKNGNTNDLLLENIKKDKQKYCLLCNWTCPIMSKIIEEDENKLNSLLHK